MSFSLASVLIILIVFPGLFFRKGYYSYPFSKKWIPENLASDLIYSILPSVLLHVAFGYAISNWVTFHHHQVDYDIFLKFLSSNSDSQCAKDCIENIEEHKFCIFWYHVSLWTASFLLGHLCRIFVKGFKLDLLIKGLRFNNEWHYILSGEIMYKINGKYFSDLRFVTVVLKSDKSTITYKGMLADYQLGSKGTLDTICLRHTERLIWKREKSEYVNVDGDIFVIPANEIANLNIDYLYVEDITPEEKYVSRLTVVSIVVIGLVAIGLAVLVFVKLCM